MDAREFASKLVHDKTYIRDVGDNIPEKVLRELDAKYKENGNTSASGDMGWYAAEHFAPAAQEMGYPIEQDVLAAEIDRQFNALGMFAKIKFCTRCASAISKAQGKYGVNRKHAVRNRARKTSGKPKLVLVAGCSGSGKSTVAEKLVKFTNYELLDDDAFALKPADSTSEQAETGAKEHKPGIYMDDLGDAEYETALALARENLELGRSVIVSAPFLDIVRDRNTWLEAKFADTRWLEEECDVRLVWLVHDEDVERKRIEARGARQDEGRLANWDEYAESVSGIKPDPAYGAFLFDNTDREEDELDEMLRLVAWLVLLDK